MSIKVKNGVAHIVPMDLRKLLTESPTLLLQWNSLTPLARNEWICWTISVQKKETRINHLKRLREEISNGKRRPCCWPGCAHRKKVK